MGLHSYAELAEKADAAVFSLLSGTVSSYSIAGRTFTKHDLRALQEIAEYYRQMASQEKHGQFGVADFRGNTGD
jgi:hypothetical protein